VVAALRAIRDLGRAAAAALRAGDWRGLARVVDENWRQQRCLDPTISTPAVQRVEDAARAAGAWGLKATGAGAGGCLLILAPPERVPRIHDAIRATGASPLDSSFAAEGAQVWEDDAQDA
jgi:galactokinase/mevalonate kinase-like predicted kinase